MIPGGYSTRLDIFVTSRCNLRCGYCSSGEMVERAGGLSLGTGQLARAVDLFAGYGKPGAASPRTISFSGGEPLLEFNAVAAAIRHIRKQKEKFRISVTTNGTLLRAEHARFLRENGACLVISLDGTPAATDRHRKFASGTGSVSGAVIRNLKKIPARWRPEHVTLTVTSRTIGSVVESARFLEDLGFGYVEIGLDVYEIWTPGKLALLRKTLAAFRKYSLRSADLAALRRGGGNLFRSFFQDYAPHDEILPVDTLCLSPEGFFFPCDALCAARPRQDAYIIGDLERGVDFKKFRRIYTRAFAVIRRHGAADGVLSPADRYFYALTHGADPAAILENGTRVEEIFAAELGDLKALEEAALAAARRGRPGGEAMRLLRAEPPGAQRAAGAVYAAFDTLLASAGKKDCVLSGGRTGARGLALYALLAAKKNGRKLAVRVEK